jgi:outer membrane protein OmpA-like peptidoglycan-associated protein
MAVSVELVRKGVPAGSIAASGQGDQRLLVPTGPNTRERMNRRVEIILPS